MRLNFIQAYPRTFKRWVSEIFREPGSWLQTSIVILVLSLPVVTWGFAYGFGHLLSYRKAEGSKIRLKIQLDRYLHSKLARDCFLMGLIDIAVLILAFFTLRTLTTPESPMFSKIFSSLFIWIDLVYWMSSLYRYPMMVIEREASFTEVIIRSLFLTVTKIGHSFLFLVFKFSILIISILTGIGIIVFFTGSLSLLNVHHWLEIRKVSTVVIDKD